MPEPGGLLPRRELVLGYVSGGREPAGHTVLLDRDEVLVGRTAEARLQIKSGIIARRHAKFVRTAGGWDLVDVGSSGALHQLWRLFTLRELASVPVETYLRSLVLDATAIEMLTEPSEPTSITVLDA